MFDVWTRHLANPEEKERFKGSVVASKPVLDRAKEILDKMEQDLDQVEVNPKYYETPNWDYRQAHNNGYRQCLRIVKKLIDLDKQVIKEKE